MSTLQLSMMRLYINRYIYGHQVLYIEHRMLGRLIFDIMKGDVATRAEGEANVARLTQRVRDFEERLRDTIDAGRLNGGQ